MATVIDELIVRLGLDPSGFNKGQKEAAQSFLKTKNDAASAAKDMGNSGKKAGEFFGQLRGQVLLLFAAFAGGKSIKQFVADLTSTDALLGRVANIIGSTTQELSKWQGAAEAMGGSASGAANSIASLDRQLVNISLIPGSGDAIIPYLRALKVNLQGANGDIKTATELLPELNAAIQGMDKRRAASLLAGIGLNQDLINVVLLSQAEFKAAMADQQRYGLVTKEQAKAAQDLQKAWNGVYKSFETIGRVLLTSMTPSIVKVTKYLTDMFVWFQSHPKEMEQAFIAISAAVTGVALVLAGPIAACALLAAAVAALYIDWLRWNETGESAFGDFWQDVVDGWNKIEAVARDVWDAIKGTVMPILDALGKVFYDLTQVWINSFKLVYAVFFGTSEDIQKAWSNLTGSIGKTWSDLWNGLAKAIYNAMPAIWAAVKKVFGWVIDRANTVWRAITGHDLINASGGAETDKKETEEAAGAVGGSVGSAVGNVAATSLSGAARQKQQAEDIEYYQSKGWTKDQAAGIVANIYAESGGNERIPGDGGKAYGLAQWHPDRQANFKAKFGHDIREGTRDEQREFVDWELRNTESAAGDRLKKARDAREAGAIVSKYYERPAAVNEAASNRAAIAGALAKAPPSSAYATPNAGDVAQASGAGGKSSTSTATTTIDTLNVYSKADDAAGISDDLQREIAKRDANAMMSNGGMQG